MTTVLRDSTSPYNIPAGTPIVGGYVDGLYGLNTRYWNAAAWAYWKGKGVQLRQIACVTTTTRSNVADVERFDLSPADAPKWWLNMHALGIPDLWVYCNLSNRQAVEDSLHAAGVPPTLCSMWIATLNGVIEPLSVYRYPIAAQQWIDRGAYDESIVYGDSEMNLDDEIQPGLTVRQFFTFVYAELIKGEPQNPPHDILAVIKAQGAATEPPEPKTITGTFTGSLS